MKISELETFGKVQPHALDLEEAVLGAIILESNYVPKIELILPSDAFYHPSHKTVYKSILSLKNAKFNVDLLTVIDKLRSNQELDKIGGAYFVTELTNKVTSSANVEFYAKIVFQKWVNRVLIEMSSKLIEDAYTDIIDPLELLYKSQKKLTDVVEKIIGQKQVEMRNVYFGAINNIAERFTNKDTIQFTGNPTGFRKFDRMVGGRKKSEFVIVGARPSMGKSTFTLQEAVTMANEFKIPVCYFSIEMSAHQMIIKTAAHLAKVNSENIERGQINNSEYENVIQKLTELMDDNMLIIDDGTAPTITEIKTKAALYKEKYGIQAIYIDYLQLVRPTEKGRTRDQEIDEIGRGLKELAKDLDMPVIALSQLSREVEKRADKRPMLSDLRDGGNIEGHADVVNFLYRPEYYGISVYLNNSEFYGLTEVITAKNRNGKIGVSYFKFNKEISTFEELSDNDEYELNKQSSTIKKQAAESKDWTKPKSKNSDDIPF
jgi:replicative DNA helicase